MPAASQSEPQDAYREAEKTNTEGCPFCILDAFPSRKYQSSPGTLQNRFTLPLPYKGLNTLALRLCVYVYTCLSVRRCAGAARISLGENISHSWLALISSRDGASGSISGGLGKLKADLV